MLQNFRSTQVNNKSMQIIYRSIQIIYKSVKSEEYESNSTPRSDNLRFLICRSIKISTKYLKDFEILEVLAQKHPAKKRLSFDKSWGLYEVGSSKNMCWELAGPTKNYPQTPNENLRDLLQTLDQPSNQVEK